MMELSHILLRLSLACNKFFARLHFTKFSSLYFEGVSPAMGVSLSCPGTSGIFQKAVFMNSASHGKVWTKNVASSF
jgi:hypothetical protein